MRFRISAAAAEVGLIALPEMLSAVLSVPEDFDMIGIFRFAE